MVEERIYFIIKKESHRKNITVSIVLDKQRKMHGESREHKEKRLGLPLSKAQADKPVRELVC